MKLEITRLVTIELITDTLLLTFTTNKLACPEIYLSISWQILSLEHHFYHHESPLVECSDVDFYVSTAVVDPISTDCPNATLLIYCRVTGKSYTRSCLRFSASVMN